PRRLHGRLRRAAHRLHASRALPGGGDAQRDAPREAAHRRAGSARRADGGVPPRLRRSHRPRALGRQRPARARVETRSQECTFALLRLRHGRPLRPRRRQQRAPPTSVGARHPPHLFPQSRRPRLRVRPRRDRGQPALPEQGARRPYGEEAMPTVASLPLALLVQAAPAAEPPAKPTITIQSADAPGLKVFYLNAPWGPNTFAAMEKPGEGFYNKRSWPF